MTNKEAYIKDLDDIKKEIETMLRMVPVSKTKAGAEARKAAEEAAGRARATINCMKNDYIINE